MKITCFLVLLVLLPGVALAQQGRIAFEETTHDFGTFAEGTNAEHAFTFWNEGTAPVRLTNVLPSCGCTSPEWPREALAPGDTARILVTFHSAGYPGPFRRSVSITTDGRPEQVALYLRGVVIPHALESSAPQSGRSGSDGIAPR